MRPVQYMPILRGASSSSTAAPPASLREKRLRDECEALRSQVEAWEVLLKHQNTKISELEQRVAEKYDMTKDEVKKSLKMGNATEVASLSADNINLSRRLADANERVRTMMLELMKYNSMANQIIKLKERSVDLDSVTVVCDVFGSKGKHGHSYPEITDSEIPDFHKLQLDENCRELVALRSENADLRASIDAHNSTFSELLKAIQDEGDIRGEHDGVQGNDEKMGRCKCRDVVESLLSQIQNEANSKVCTITPSYGTDLHLFGLGATSAKYDKSCQTFDEENKGNFFTRLLSMGHENNKKTKGVTLPDIDYEKRRVGGTPRDIDYEKRRVGGTPRDIDYDKRRLGGILHNEDEKFDIDSPIKYFPKKTPPIASKCSSQPTFKRDTTISQTYSGERSYDRQPKCNAPITPAPIITGTPPILKKKPPKILPNHRYSNDQKFTEHKITDQKFTEHKITDNKTDIITPEPVQSMDEPQFSNFAPTNFAPTPVYAESIIKQLRNAASVDND
eukprot:GHVL01034404.1.p1 GENE.GHVL01034404.1~~GHVL01034404.1.p1  ORF type:complete len:507 (-),score=116.20 GHVL01034404.1:31-1551(-)